MMQIKERYLWAAFIVVVIALSLFFRYYYQTPLSINVSLGSVSGTKYPLQEVTIPITMSNPGSATINNLSVGLYTNGNTTRVYRVYLPAGKQATVYYNFTPSTSGTYTISVVADPSKLYDIVNRQLAQSSTTLTISPAEKPAPYANFPANAVGQDMFYMNPRGFIASLYFDNFTVSNYLDLINPVVPGSEQVNNFLYPALDVFTSYQEINQMVVSHAYYSNYSLASIWISGYISPFAFDTAATGKGINFTQYKNTSVINFGNDTTLCSWYSGGWTKILVSLRGENCTAYTTSTTNLLKNNKIYYVLKNRNESLLNYSGYNYYGNLTYAGDISINSNALVLESVIKSANLDNTCYYNVLNISNNSYCQQYFYQGNVILNQVSRLIGDYNVSVMWIPSNSASQQSIAYALNLSDGYSALGNKTTAYVYAYASKCEFLQDNITCGNPVFASNATELRIGLNITNRYGKSITLNSLGCALEGNFTTSKLNADVPPGGSETVHVPCYNRGKEINASITPAGDPLSLKLNYTYNNIANATPGLAEIYT